MFKNRLSTRVLALSAGLAALSAAVQLIHIGYKSPTWGMWIDLVAVTWFIGFFLFGAYSSFLISLLGALIITFFAPDTWLGASMKWVATAPLWICLALWLKFTKKKLESYGKFTNIVIPIVIALVLRSLIVLPLNYFYAIPIWTGMTPEKAIAAIPWYIIVGFNTLQGVIDVLLAWFVVFRFRISRFADWR